MELTPGRSLGPYQIVEKVGAGGMGSVYRARDTRLERSVAIKVLPEGLTDDPRLRERLAQEARSISALSHPNICALYDIGHEEGVDYLVMEFIEGETLADRISRTGALPLRQALGYGADIAAALDAAHRAGVIHRDLKPGNIMLARSGARLLDFGLARQNMPEVSAAGDQPTARMALTEPGTVVGTLMYMSPEQAEGRALDPRSDIFSFGVVLYEMLSGKRAFDGPTRVSILHSIVSGQPAPLTEIAPQVPESADRVVRKCLEKSPDDRWQSAHDLADELRWVGGTSSSATRQFRTGTRPRWWLAAAGAALLVVAGLTTILTGALHRPEPAGHAHAIRFGINPPPGFYFAQRATNTELALSPDGRQLALVALQGGRRSLFVRRLDELTAREIDGTEGAVSPFWSPDGKWIGFFANGSMKKVLPAGGASQTICAAQGGTASWSANGTILFAEWGESSEQIQRIAETGGTPKPVGERAGWHFWPMFLRDGHHYLVHINRGASAENGIYLASLDDSKLVRLVGADSRVEVGADNWLYFVDQGVLSRQQLDVDKGRMLGTPETVAQPIYIFTPTGASNFSVDAAGDVVVFQRSPTETQLVWRDRDGHETGRLKGTFRCRKFRLSPDGQRVAIDQFDPKTGVSSIWLYDVSRDVISRLTSNPYGTHAPIWMRDGRELLVSDTAEGQEKNPPQLTRFQLGSNARRPLSVDDGVQYANDITFDGSAAIYTVTRGKQSDLELLSMAGDRKKTPLEFSQFNETDGTLSPDGRWLVFVSDQSGRPEVYVRSFPEPGERLRVSSDGGIEPRWSPLGTELFYLGPDGNLMRVPIAAGAPLKVGRALSLFHISSAGMMENHEFGSAHYDIAPDGQHFLVREIAQGADEAPVVVLAGAAVADRVH